MAPFIFFIISVIFFLSINNTVISLASMNECQGPTLNRSPAAMFIFGNSYFDPGNNNYLNTTFRANFWPYGETYFKFPTGRYSDGRLISDFIAEYAELPLIPPFVQSGIEDWHQHGVNFASSGSGALVETNKGMVISLQAQLMYYKKVEAWLRKDVRTKDILSRGVYLFSIGTNDYLSPFATKNFTLLTIYGPSQYVEMVVGNITTAIIEIYKKGGRKFGFLNVEPLGCSPILRRLNPRRKKGGCYKEPTLLAKMHNKALLEMLKGMEKQLPGFKYSLYDFYTNVKERLNHPSKYGLKEGKTACCGTGLYRGNFTCGRSLYQLCPNPNSYLYWDSLHKTERAYEQMAYQWWNEAGIGPYSLRTLFYCL